MTDRYKIHNDPLVGDVVFRKRKGAGRISIRVHPKKGVTVSLPWLLPYSAGMEFFLSKKDWIIAVMERQRRCLESAVNAGTAVAAPADGMSLKTLMSEIRFRRDAGLSGNRVAVAVEPQTGNAGIAVKTVRYPESFPPESSQELVRMLSDVLIALIRAEAKEYLPKKLSLLAERYGFFYNKVFIKHNSTNWGSCSSRSNINLNLNVMRLPEILCDYVLLHELCHLEHHDHGKAFHELLEKVCADNLSRYAADSVPDDPYAVRLKAEAACDKSEWPVQNVMRREMKKYVLV